jgi:hypothetical protein
MSMKRFLILSIVIVFLTVSCAGPNKVGWTKPDFRQDQFENDRKECNESIDKNLDSEAFGEAREECLEAFGKAFGECLEKKGYEFKKPEEPPSGNKVTAEDIGLIALFIVLSPLIIAYGVWLIGQPL